MTFANSTKAQRAFLGVGLGALVVVAYSSSLRGEFQFDDTNFAVTAASVGLERFVDLATWVEGLTSSGRPVTQLTFAINWATTGGDPLPYHAVNLVLHLAQGALVFALTRKTLRRLGRTDVDAEAALATAVFVLHPLQTQAVSYIAQRGEVLASVLYAAALVLLVASDDSGGRHRRWLLRGGALLVFLLALASKQVAATLPVAWLLHCAFFPTDGEAETSPLRRIARRVPAAAPFIALAIFATAGGLVAARGRPDVGFDIGWLDASDYLLTQFRVVPTYLRLLVWPSGQTVDWVFPPSRGLLDPATTLLGAVFLVALVAIAAYGERRTRGARTERAGAARLASFGVLWFLLLLVPSSSVVPLADVIQEHRCYFASWGIIAGAIDVLLAFGGGASRLQAQNTATGVMAGGFGRRAAVVVVVVVVAGLGAATWNRNRVWRTEVQLWADAARKSPLKSRVHANLGSALARAGRPAEALDHYSQAFRLLRDHSTPIDVLVRNAAAAMCALGRNHDATTLLEGLVYGGTAAPETIHDLAALYLEAGRTAEGERLLRGVLVRSPGLARAHNTLGDLLSRRGDASAALDEFATAARLEPWNSRWLLNLGEAEYWNGRIADACRTLDAASVAPVGFTADAARAASLLGALRCRERDVPR